MKHIPLDDFAELDQHRVNTLLAQMKLHGQRLRAMLSAKGETLNPPALEFSELEDIQAMETHIDECELCLGKDVPEFNFQLWVTSRFSNAVKSGLTNCPHPTHETISGCGKLALYSTPPEVLEVLAQIAELQARTDAAIAEGMKYTPRAAAEDYRAHNANATEGVMQTGTAEGCQFKSLEQFEAEYRHKVKSAIALSKTFAPKAAELLKPHVENYVRAVRSFADQIASKEQSLCEAISLPWKPSGTVITLYKCADVVEEHGGRGQTPADCAKFLPLTAVPAAAE